MKHKPILAIDIGTTKVACALGQPFQGHVGYPLASSSDLGFELIGCGAARYPTLSSTWPPDRSVVARAVEQALEETHATSIPDQALVSLTHPELSHSRVPAQIDLSDEPITIRSRDLQRLSAQALSQGLAIDRHALLLEAFGYSGNGFQDVKDPCGLMATRLTGTFHLIAIPIAARHFVMQSLESVGVEVDHLIYSLRAAAAACLDERALSKRVLLLDIGGCCTDAAILDRGTLVNSLTVPWGGMCVAEAVAKECRVTMEQALTMSLGGLGSANSSVRRIVEQQLRVLQRGIHQLVKDGPIPDLAVVTGRGALMEGLVEWVERITEINATLGRSRNTKHLGDLHRQLALSPALGLLTLACQAVPPEPSRPSRLVDRLIDQTRHLLIEYF